MLMGICISVSCGQKWILKRFPSYPYRPDPPRGPPSLISNGYWGPFPLEYTARGVTLTTRLHLVPRLQICEVMPRHHPYVFNAYRLINHRDNCILRVVLNLYTYLLLVSQHKSKHEGRWAFHTLPRTSSLQRCYFNSVRA
jgi:hypothetical protein